MTPTTRKSRRQYTSCDGCHASHLRCDASATTWSSCSRCSRRQRRCTFHWMRKNAAALHPTTPPGQLLRNSGNWQHELRESRCDDLDSIPDFDTIADALWSIYFGVFEELYGTLLANAFPYSAPTEPCHSAEPLSPTLEIKREPLKLSPPISVFNLSCLLDQWSTEHATIHSASMFSTRRSENSSIDACLLSAIYAFSARWLSSTYDTSNHQRSVSWYQDIAVQLWCKARVEMLRASNRFCYRSVLAMMLFGLTPVPSAISKDEEMNGLTGHTCIQLSLQMLQGLRSQPRTWQFSSSGALTRGKTLSKEIGANTYAEKKFLQAETYLYWTCVTFDTATAVTLDKQSILSGGVLAFKAGATFELIKRRSLVLQEELKEWHLNEIDFDNNLAIKVISATGLWKLYLYIRVAGFKESLRDGHEEGKVLWAFQEAIDAIHHFERLYRPILDVYEKRLRFLNQRSRFEWFIVMLHWNLGVLMLRNAAATSGRLSLLKGLVEPEAETVQNVVNILKFGLENTYTPTASEVPANLKKCRMFLPTNSAACFITWDPYPHHTTAAIKFVFEVISSNFAGHQINRDTFKDLHSVLLSSLKAMPSCSTFIQETKHIVEAANHH